MKDLKHDGVAVILFTQLADVIDQHPQSPVDAVVPSNPSFARYDIEFGKGNLYSSEVQIERPKQEINLNVVRVFLLDKTVFTLF